MISFVFWCQWVDKLRVRIKWNKKKSSGQTPSIIKVNVNSPWAAFFTPPSWLPSLFFFFGNYIKFLVCILYIFIYYIHMKKKKTFCFMTTVINEQRHVTSKFRSKYSFIYILFYWILIIVFQDDLSFTPLHPYSNISQTFRLNRKSL